eukprot:198728_1
MNRLAHLVSFNMDVKQTVSGIDLNLNQLIESLPKWGNITYDPNTSYWYIKLPKQWQNAKERIRETASSFLKSSDNYTKSIDLGKSWSSMIHTSPESSSTPVIHCVSPPSIAGLHVSLTQQRDNNDKPKQLIKGKKVSFTISNVKSLLSIRKHPQNIDGQHTSNDGSRYYPTLWVLADLQFCNFAFQTRYPPHISLACVAVRLSVHDVARFEIKRNLKKAILQKTPSNNTNCKNCKAEAKSKIVWTGTGNSIQI